MKKLRTLLPLALFVLSYMACQTQAGTEAPKAEPKVKLVHHQADSRIEVLIQDELFTAYLYHDSMEKPVLYPILTHTGKAITRGFPYHPRSYERVDHPHHVGHWLNYGDVNGLDFWNNSYRVPAEKKHRYGLIRHQEIEMAESEDTHASLKVRMYWEDIEGNRLLEEQTHFRFSTDGPIRIIDRKTNLKALSKAVAFTDNKEGFVAIRMTRELELPTSKPQLLTDANGQAMEEKIVPPKGLSGNYLSSEGLEGGAVWGTRARWMRLSGMLEDAEASVVIMDHPQNPGYPTYWHARAYGLFAANPLGQKVFSKGAETLNFSLKAGESVDFQYRILVHEGQAALDKAQIEQFADF